MEEIETISLESLVGEHDFDGCDLSSERVQTWGEHFEMANVFRVRLDGKVYTAVESPDDGYRSSMDKLFVENCEIKNWFPPVRVMARKKPDDNWGKNDTLELIDVVTGKTVAEFGTDNSDDYYPSFVSAFWPENMATNAAVQS